MKPITSLIICLAGILATVWGGAFAFSMIDVTHWAHFPTYVTCCLAFVSFTVGVAYSWATITE